MESTVTENVVSVNSFNNMLDSLKNLQQFISDNPDTLECLRLLKDTHTITISEKTDRLITVKEACNVLGVSPNRIGEYVRNRILIAYFTPPASKRKFWLSEVKAIAREGSNDGGLTNDTVQGKG